MLLLNFVDGSPNAPVDTDLVSTNPSGLVEQPLVKQLISGSEHACVCREVCVRARRSKYVLKSLQDWDFSCQVPKGGPY